MLAVIWKTALGETLGSLRSTASQDASDLAELSLRQFQLLADIRLSARWWKMWPELFPKYRKFAEVDDAVQK